MFTKKEMFFLTIYCGIIVICKMINGAEKDIYTPNKILKKNTSVMFRKVLYISVITFFIYALGFYIIADIPGLANRSFGYGSNFVEKGCVILYCLLNLIAQTAQLKRARNSREDSDSRCKKIMYICWKTALYSFTFVLLFSLMDLVNDHFIGMAAGTLYFIYNLCFLIFSLHKSTRAV